jgi:hypothetical protein
MTGRNCRWGRRVFVSITDTKITAVLPAIDLAPFEVGDLGDGITFCERDDVLRVHPNSIYLLRGSSRLNRASKSKSPRPTSA